MSSNHVSTSDYLSSDEEGLTFEQRREQHQAAAMASNRSSANSSHANSNDMSNADFLAQLNQLQDENNRLRARQDVTEQQLLQMSAATAGQPRTVVIRQQYSKADKSEAKVKRVECELVVICLIQRPCNSQRLVEYKIQQFAGDNDRPRRFSNGAAFNQSPNKKLVSDICDWVVAQTTCALDRPAVKDLVKMAFRTWRNNIVTPPARRAVRYQNSRRTTRVTKVRAVMDRGSDSTAWFTDWAT